MPKLKAQAVSNNSLAAVYDPISIIIVHIINHYHAASRRGVQGREAQGQPQRQQLRAKTRTRIAQLKQS
jgi:hypothetical protein